VIYILVELLVSLEKPRSLFTLATQDIWARLSHDAAYRSYRDKIDNAMEDLEKQAGGKPVDEVIDCIDDTEYNLLDYVIRYTYRAALADVRELTTGTGPV
jgi:hypothetical protein